MDFSTVPDTLPTATERARPHSFHGEWNYTIALGGQTDDVVIRAQALRKRVQR